jgi:nitrite reductase/ring-hydroxylating ferredoxin subunit
VSGWRNLRFAPGPGTRLCDLDEVPPSGLDVVFGEGRDAFHVAVFVTADGVRAYHNRCPHFSIPLNVGAFSVFSGSVICVNHFAMFRIADGYCIDGPCKGGNLDAIPVAADGAGIVVA